MTRSNVSNTSNVGLNNVSTAYLLWAVWFFGFSGLHRLYNGKVVTGLLWFFTFGLFGVGQLIDVFLIPGMVEDRNLKLRAKYGLSPAGVPLYQTIVAETVVRPPTHDEQMVKLVKAAAARGGKLSVTQAVMDTGISFGEAEKLLHEMVKAHYVGIDNDPDTGVVLYDFKEL